MRIPPAILFLIAPLMGAAAPITAYVDSAVIGTSANDGTSWANAWTNFASISWDSLATGSNTLYISGGISGVTYTDELEVKHTSSTATDRLTIRCGQDAGHLGRVTLAGGIQLGDESANAGHNVTVDGESNGVRNIYLTRATATATVNVRYDDTLGIQLRYLDITTTNSGTEQTHCIDLGSYADGTEICYCNLHDSFSRAIREGSGTPTAYGRISVHHNSFLANNDDDLAIDGGVDFYNNVSDGTGCDPATHPDGIQGVKGWWRIYNNVFHDHTQEIFIETVATNLANVLIYNNVFYDADATVNSPAIIFRAKQPTGWHGWSNIVIANNTIHGMRMSALRITIDADITNTLTACLLANNIWSSNSANTAMNGGGEGICTWPVGGFNWVANILHSPQTATWQSTDYTTVADLQAAHADAVLNLTSDPLFVSVATRDYRLSAGSPAIGAGTNLSAFFTTDILGSPRSATPSIGAYEWIAPARVMRATTIKGNLKGPY